MRNRLAAATRSLGITLLFATAAAHAAPVTLPLNYIGGPPGYTMFGSITFDDSLLAPNTSVGSSIDLAGLNAFSLTLTGPGVPGGSTSFTLADIDGWVFRTDGAGAITDINFFGGVNAANCTITGVDPFLLHFDCNEGTVFGDMRLVLSSAAVPALEPAALALVALLVAGLAGTALRRRA